MDIFDKDKRSSIMSAVKSKGNKSTEIKLLNIFKELNIKGWRRHYKIIGAPDFAFPKLKIAIFTDGCFWHGHDCRNLSPSDNKEYWQKKIERNKLRDEKVNISLEKKGWLVIRIWECEFKKNNIEQLKMKLSLNIKDNCADA